MVFFVAFCCLLFENIVEAISWFELSNTYYVLRVFF